MLRGLYILDTNALGMVYGPDQRQAIEKRVLEEEPYGSIAADIGCSEQVVRKRVSRGLATLRREVKEKA